MKKFTTFILVLIGIFGITSIYKDTYLRSKTELELSKALNQQVTISSANLNLFTQNISYNEIVFPNDGIKIDNLNFDLEVIKSFKEKSIYISNANISDISFIKPKLLDAKRSVPTQEKVKTTTINSGNSEVSRSVNAFLKELTKSVGATRNLGEVFSSKFDINTISAALSKNLNTFLIENVDYIDVIIQHGVNSGLKTNLDKFKTDLNKGLSQLEVFKNSKQPIYVHISKLNITGKYMNFDFVTTLDNISNDFSKNNDLKFNINFSQGESAGNIVGNFNFSDLTSSATVKAPKIDFNTFPEMKKYFNSGSLALDFALELKNSTLTAKGTTSVYSIDFNNEGVLNSIDTSTLNKSIITEVLTLIDKDVKEVSANINYSTDKNYIFIKTSLPNELKSILIRKQGSNNFKEIINTYYENNIKDKKQGVVDLFNKFKSIF